MILKIVNFKDFFAGICINRENVVILYSLLADS